MKSRLIPLSLLITSALIAFGLFFSNGDGSLLPHSDGGSHYVTGLLAFDWIHLGHFTNPIAFGTEYFRHFPYIGILLWPPFFYVLEMVAFSIFGPTIYVSMVLVTCIFVAAGTLVGYAVWKSGRNYLVAHGVIAVTLTSVLIQELQQNILVDGLVAFLSFATALTFSSYVLKPTIRGALAVSALAILAFYSKGNALQLALILPLIAVLMRRPNVLIIKSSLLLAAICIIITGPWLYLTAGLSGQGALYTPGLSSFLIIFKSGSLTLFNALPLLAPFSLVGVIFVGYKFITAHKTGEAPSAFEATSFAAMIGCVGFHALIAVSDDARYMLTALFGMVGLAIVGIETMAFLVLRWVGYEKTDGAKFFFLIALLMVQVLLSILAPIAPIPMGADRLATEVINALPKENRSLLVSGDHNVESAIGPALAQIEGKKRIEKDGLVVVRASRALVGGGYRNRDFIAKFNTDDEYRNEIRRLGVPIIVTGSSTSTDSWPHIAAIERIIKSQNSDYLKVAEVTFFKGQVVTVWKLNPVLVKPIDFEEVTASNTLRERVSKVTAKPEVKTNVVQ